MQKASHEFTAVNRTKLPALLKGMVIFMKRIGRRAMLLFIVLIYFFMCTAAFIYKYISEAEKWVVHPANKNVYTNGILKGSGSILSSDGTVLFTSDSSGLKYAQDINLRMATLHAVGDMQGSINTGILKTHRASIIGFDHLTGVYNVGQAGGTVTLTLDADTCKAAYEALGNRNGTVGVYNYKTGKIICMISKPSYDPQNIPDLTTDAYKGVYLNRLTAGVYTPGSVFKVITTAAALENIPDIHTRTFTCNKGADINGEWVACTNNHGQINFEDAFAESCNAVYAAISLELGEETLAKYAYEAGVGKQFKIEDIYTSKGKFDVDNINHKVQLAWAGIGQHTDLVNPMQYMIYMGAIANGGQAVTPYYIGNVNTSLGIPSNLRFNSKESRMLSTETADELKKLMRNNSVKAYVDANFAGMNLCAKTGTAQVDDGESHAWFVGFLDNPDTPLAFVVILEHGGNGFYNAAPVARKVLQQAVKTFEQ